MPRIIVSIVSQYHHNHSKSLSSNLVAGQIYDEVDNLQMTDDKNYYIIHLKILYIKKVG